MAEALIRHEAGNVFEVSSAGTHPAQVRVRISRLWNRPVGLAISAGQLSEVASIVDQVS